MTAGSLRRRGQDQWSNLKDAIPATSRTQGAAVDQIVEQNAVQGSALRFDRARARPAGLDRCLRAGRRLGNYAMGGSVVTFQGAL